jgi:hypothetical protein
LSFNPDPVCVLDAAGVCAVDDEVRNPVRQRASFAGSGASDDEERWSDRAALRHTMFDSEALLWIQFIEISGSCRHRWLPCAESVILR